MRMVSELDFTAAMTQCGLILALKLKSKRSKRGRKRKRNYKDGGASRSTW